MGSPSYIKWHEKKRIHSSVYIKRGYTSILDNGYEMETSDGKMNSTNAFVALRGAETI